MPATASITGAGIATLCARNEISAIAPSTTITVGRRASIRRVSQLPGPGTLATRAEAATGLRSSPSEGKRGAGRSEAEVGVEVAAQPRRRSVRRLAKSRVRIRQPQGRGHRPAVRRWDVDDEIDFVREGAVDARGGEAEALVLRVEQELVVDQVGRHDVVRLQRQAHLMGDQVAVREDELSEELPLGPGAPLRGAREEGVERVRAAAAERRVAVAEPGLPGELGELVRGGDVPAGGVRQAGRARVALADEGRPEAQVGKDAQRVRLVI